MLNENSQKIYPLLHLVDEETLSAVKDAKSFEDLQKSRIFQHVLGDINDLTCQDGNITQVSGKNSTLTLDNPVALDLTCLATTFKNLQAEVRATLKNQMAEAVTKGAKSMDNIALVAAQIRGTQRIEAAIEQANYDELLESLKSEVNDLIRSDACPSNKLRDALIIDAIYRLKTVCHLKQHKVSNQSKTWLWKTSNRAYFDQETSSVIIKQGDCQVPFNYDFIDDVSRLVITPLTIEAYHNHMIAICNNKIMNSTGPAGCGKTETLKDLAKNLGYTTYVFNCSDQMGLKFWNKSMWSDLKSERCFFIFDEFNRIPETDDEIITAVRTLSEAISNPGVEGFQVGTTFNPGYAGRVKVPLLEKFMTLPLQVPDMQDIIEGLLAKSGLTDYVNLAEYFVRLREKCRNYLKPNDIYDFGMRPVHYACRAAGKFLARQDESSKCELKALQDGIKLHLAARFTKEDWATFSKFIDQFFADAKGTDFPDSRVEQMKLMMELRHGLVALGDEPKALEFMSKVGESTGHKIYETRYENLDQFYGKIDDQGNWTDGLFTKIFRQISHDNEKAIICITGVQDLKDIVAIMAENLNQIMDDNKKLILATKEVIQLKDNARICFCTNEARTWSPASVSRVGAVRVD